MVSKPENIDFYMDEMSSDEVADYFYIDNQREHRTLYVKTKASPLRIDKPEINFVISARSISVGLVQRKTNKFSLPQFSSRQAMMRGENNDVDYDLEAVSSYSPSSDFQTRVNIKVMDSTGRSMTKQPSFKSPSLAHYLLTLNLTESRDGMINGGGGGGWFSNNNKSIYELQATSPIGSVISYRIINSNNTPFYIENNIIELSKEALYSKYFRNSYLVKILF